MKRIAREEYERFSVLKHLFLVGDLQRESPHAFIRDARLELILCYYEAGDDGLPHWHSKITEYELVLEGQIGYLDTGTGEIAWFGPGDLSIVPPGTCVRRFVPKRARTVAIKVPSSAEKVHCAECPRECAARLLPVMEAACA